MFVKGIVQKLTEKVDILERLSKSNDFIHPDGEINEVVSQVERQLCQIHSMKSSIKVVPGQEWDPQKSTTVIENKTTNENPQTYKYSLQSRASSYVPLTSRESTVSQNQHGRTISRQSAVSEVRKVNIHNQYRQLKCVHLDHKVDNIFVFGNEVWVAAGKSGVYKYDLEFKQKKHIKHDQYEYCISVVRSNSHIIVCDKQKGLHLINPNGDYLCGLHNAHFSDVCLSNDQLFALEYKEGIVYGFNFRLGVWEKGPEYKLTKYSEPSENDRLCTNGTHLYISQYEKETLLVYNMTGEFVFESEKIDWPFVGDADSSGKVLACNKWLNRLQVLEKEINEWTVLNGSECLKRPIAVTASDTHIWVCSDNDRVFVFKKL